MWGTRRPVQAAVTTDSCNESLIRPRGSKGRHFLEAATGLRGGKSLRRPPGTLGPAWTPLPPSLLVGGSRENRPEPGTILTDRLLVRENLGEPGTKLAIRRKWTLDEAGPLPFRHRSVGEPYDPLHHGSPRHMPAGRNGRPAWHSWRMALKKRETASHLAASSGP
ncbi:unnamed protein product [Boreogadus saida]